MRNPPRPSRALEQMLRENGELDQLLDGRGLEPTPVIEVGPPAEPPQPLVIAPPPWSPDYDASLDVVPDFVEAEALTEAGSPQTLTESGIERNSAPAASCPQTVTGSGLEANTEPGAQPNGVRPRGKQARRALRRSIRQAWAR